jgi:hypothetical protein
MRYIGQSNPSIALQFIGSCGWIRVVARPNPLAWVSFSNSGATSVCPRPTCLPRKLFFQNIFEDLTVVRGKLKSCDTTLRSNHSTTRGYTYN